MREKHPLDSRYTQYLKGFSSADLQQTMTEMCWLLLRLECQPIQHRHFNPPRAQTIFWDIFNLIGTEISRGIVGFAGTKGEPDLYNNVAWYRY